MSGLDMTCLICQKDFYNPGSATCPYCGQQYEWAEKSQIVLAEEQIALLRAQAQAKRRRLEGAAMRFEVAHRLEDPDGLILLDYRIGTKFDAPLTRDARVVIAPSPPIDTELLVRFKQDAIGIHRVTWPKGIRWRGRSEPIIEPRPHWSTIVVIHSYEAGLFAESVTWYEP